MHNNTYQQETDDLIKTVRKLEESWIAQDPSKHSELDEKHPNPMFKPSSEEVDRYSKCLRCEAKSWSCESITEAARHNGDAYGYEYTYCGKCGWGKKRLWDEYCS